MTRLNSKLHIKHLINLRNIIFKENKIRHPKIKFLNINKGMKNMENDNQQSNNFKQIRKT